jgi:hypothetical protein
MALDLQWSDEVVSHHFGISSPRRVEIFLNTQFILLENSLTSDHI